MAVTEAKIISFCKKRLPHYMFPKIAAFIESLPETSTSKIQMLRCTVLYARPKLVYWGNTWMDGVTQRTRRLFMDDNCSFMSLQCPEWMDGVTQQTPRCLCLDDNSGVFCPFYDWENNLSFAEVKSFRENFITYWKVRTLKTRPFLPGIVRVIALYSPHHKTLLPLDSECVTKRTNAL